jgi:NADH:ubiquinone oxidoreductase subunit E
MSKAIAGWSAPNRERAARILAGYPESRSAVMPLLYLAFLEHGHITDAAMAEVSALTGLTAAQVESVASFYTMYKRRPVGMYLVSVCTSISCYLVGSDDVLAAVEEEAGALDGETSADGSITVEHVECIGACGGATAVQVNYENVEGVVPDKARGLVRWLREAQPDVVLGDEMQTLFGGRPSFPRGPADSDGAIAPVPAFGPYGSAEEGR